MSCSTLRSHFSLLISLLSTLHPHFSLYLITTLCACRAALLLIQNHKGEVMAATCDRIGKASNALWVVAVITRKALLFCQINYFLDIIACGSSQF